jgi:hypothetical protein
MNFQAKNILKSNQYHTPQHPFKVYWVRGYIETFWKLILRNLGNLKDRNETLLNL